MEPLILWGLEIIQSIQPIQHPLLNTFFLTITSLGSGMTVLLVLPLLFWCVDYNLGIRVAIVCTVSVLCNVSLKDFFAQPRPFDLDPGVALTTARGYGFPSGHAQGSLVLWGSIAAWANKRWLWAVTVFLVTLIGFSRVYLGVHFPADVLAGWLVGGGLLILYCTLQPKIEGWITAQPLLVQVLIVPAVSLGLLLIPAEKVLVYQLGIFFGIGMGAILRVRFIPFPVNATRWKILVRYCSGITILFTLFTALRNIYPAQLEPEYPMAGFLFAAVTGLWISLGAPFFFRLLKL